MPVIEAIVERIFTVFCSISTTNIKMTMTPVTVIATESSGLVLFKSMADIAVTKATPMILKISISYFLPSFCFSPILSEARGLR